MDVENYSVPEDSRFLYEYKKEGIMTTVGKRYCMPWPIRKN